MASLQTGQLRYQGVKSGMGKDPAGHPDEIWVPSVPPFQWVQSRSSQSINLTTHVNLVPSLKWMELYLHFFISLNDMGFN